MLIKVQVEDHLQAEIEDNIKLYLSFLYNHMKVRIRIRKCLATLILFCSLANFWFLSLPSFFYLQDLWTKGSPINQELSWLLSATSPLEATKSFTQYFFICYKSVNPTVLSAYITYSRGNWWVKWGQLRHESFMSQIFSELLLLYFSAYTKSKCDPNIVALTTHEEAFRLSVLETLGFPNRSVKCVRSRGMWQSIVFDAVGLSTGWAQGNPRIFEAAKLSHYQYSLVWGATINCNPRNGKSLSNVRDIFFFFYSSHGACTLSEKPLYTPWGSGRALFKLQWTWGRKEMSSVKRLWI